MESSFPWLQVLPAVSDEPSYDGLRGRLPEVTQRLRSWAEHEVYVCGPAAMVDETVSRLQADGVPLSRVHRDVVHSER
jgi:NAD(P)H-flavin reductase